MSSSAQPLEGASRQSFYGTGRRKEAVARVFVKLGSGKYEVNGRPVEDYFKNVAWKNAAIGPLKFSETLNQIDVMATVKGGGAGGQAGAVRMGLSRALARFNAELRAGL
ncbi:MAG: 30S ribosomal protein S9, partial [Acidobacteria bacterium]|nr:30S ribosomal protein S9 [Acidobacteriota bacterium]